MIESINETQQSISLNSNVLFSDDPIRTRCFNCCNGFEHEEGTGTFTISKPGIYEVLFRANITSATVGDVLGLVLTSNGENLIGTQMDYTVATANVNLGVYSQRLIKVCCNSSKTIAVKNNSETLTTPMLVENANIIVKKIA